MLAVAHFIGCLGLAPAYALMVWSISDGPRALAQLAALTGLPAVKWSDAGLAPTILGACIGVLRMYELMDDMRAHAIAGDVDAIPPAKLLALPSAMPTTFPITLVWERTRRGRIGLIIGFLATLAAYIGLGALVASAGLFSFLFSLQGVEFWELLGIVAFCALFLALIPLAFLYAATRGKQGVVVDAFGVSAWHSHTASQTIAWTDTRLLEVSGTRGRHSRVVMYSQYAGDGRRLRWVCRVNDPRHTPSHRLIESDGHDSEQRAAAILALAAMYTGLTPRTFEETSVDRSSNLAALGNVLMSQSVVTSLGGGGITLLLGMTAGCGVATLAYQSLLTPAMSLVSAAALGISTLWSLLAMIGQLLRKPSRLSPAERPGWQAPEAALAGRPALLRQARNRLRNWPLATRAALLLLGSVAGLTAIISALVSGSSGDDAFLTWFCISWLTLTLLFACLRLNGQLGRDRVELLADADGLRNLRVSNERSIPWTSIASLRFTWGRPAGVLYTATTEQGDELTWASRSRFWRDEPPAASSDLGATAVDGDTFAAIVAARTGLTPAQELIS